MGIVALPFATLRLDIAILGVLAYVLLLLGGVFDATYLVRDSCQAGLVMLRHVLEDLLTIGLFVFPLFTVLKDALKLVVEVACLVR